MTKSTLAARPSKPRPDFPLFPHATGRWAKKVCGKLQYFGSWRDDPRGERAENNWSETKDDLLAGRKPRARDGAVTVKLVCDSFLTFKEAALESGELAQRTFDGYLSACTLMAATLGRSTPVDTLRPEDFQALRGVFTKRWGLVRTGNTIQVVRSVFKYAADADLIERPVKFGPGFKKPSAKSIRKLRAAGGPRMFSAEELRAVLAKADTIAKGMVLLGINGAMGNTDLALLPTKAIDLKAGWLIYPRSKTAVPRRIPLWPETVAAIKEHIATRITPKDPTDAALLFISQRGLNYIGKYKGYRVTAAMDRLMAAAGVTGRSFYDLRRTFQTIAEGARDLSAVQAVMGHAAAADDMSAIYRQAVEDERLKAVTDHVRAWLFPKKRKAK
ncbi:MAG TPA: tyrosine-type recombinase/integrase [Pirellulales bacterium]|nr:tyrosine-type recombinase/integrase [Pirellulales bacterium]